jgi:hypothetical protein
VRWYLTYRLSYRDLVEMMAERGVTVSHSTILRWVQRYVPEFERRWSRYARGVHSSWRMDESVPQQAAWEMGDARTIRKAGLPQSACRSRLQTTASGLGQNPWS